MVNVDLIRNTCTHSQSGLKGTQGQASLRKGVFHLVLLLHLCLHHNPLAHDNEQKNIGTTWHSSTVLETFVSRLCLRAPILCWTSTLPGRCLFVSPFHLHCCTQLQVRGGEGGAGKRGRRRENIRRNCTPVFTRMCKSTLIHSYPHKHIQNTQRLSHTQRHKTHRGTPTHRCAHQRAFST